MNDTKKYTVQEFIMQIEQIDYSEIIRIIRPIIIYYLTDISINSYILHRDYKVKNISKVLLPPELKTEYSEVEVNKVVEKNMEKQYYILQK